MEAKEFQKRIAEYYKSRGWADLESEVEEGLSAAKIRDIIEQGETNISAKKLPLIAM